MTIFLIVLLSISYFMYEWYNTITKVNLINSRVMQGIDSEDSTISRKQLAGLHQPCITNGGNVSELGIPVCNADFNLTCITGMYKGNGYGSNTGVCLSDIGGYCDSLYDCVPSAKGCINNKCENMTETINLPCSYDSDCIGGATCVDCVTGSGPCKDDEGNCYELVNGSCPSINDDQTINLYLCNQPTVTCVDCVTGSGPCKDDEGNCYELVNGSCPTNAPNLCDIDNRGEFRYNHICDTSLDIPLCKYDLGPKDQGCTNNEDCIQPEGGSICLTGGFKSDYNPSATLVPPTYSVSSIVTTDDVSIIKLNFKNTLLTIKSFEKGTEVNFVYSDIVRTALRYGPYYVLDQFDNDIMTVSESKFQPNIKEYVNFPNKFIQLNENQYKSGNAVLLPQNIQTNSTVAFGSLPPLQILSTCYYTETNTTTTTFTLVDSDGDFKLESGVNVLVGTTQVRFRVNTGGNFVPNINDSNPYTLESIDGKNFTVVGDLSHLTEYDSTSNVVEVMFGEPVKLDSINSNKGVCVAKLPPSANITFDSKYDLSDYTGNPCIDLFDNSVSVGPLNGFCEFENIQNGSGSVCQFSRVEDGQNYDPLPCDKQTTEYNGITYELECLISDKLTENVRNNINFLNYSYSGICAYPVHNKFKTCELYNNNCRPPYVCTEDEGGYFCDSRFDVLSCNNLYKCPPTFTCVDGYCLSKIGGYCVDNSNCESSNCNNNKIVLTFYNAGIDTKTNVPIAETTGNTINNIPNQLIQIPVDFGIGNAKDYDLYVSSKYNPDNTLTTYAFIYNGSINFKLVRIDDVVAENPKVTDIDIGKIDSNISNFTFDHSNQNLYGYTMSGTTLYLTCIYSPNTKPITKQTLYSASGTILSIDINNSSLLITSSSEDFSNRPVFVNVDIGVAQTENYSVNLYKDITNNSNSTKYTLPYYSEEIDNLSKCKFDLLNVNDSELDIVCIYNPENFESPVLGVRNKVRLISSSFFESLFSNGSNPSCPSDVGCFKTPKLISKLIKSTLASADENETHIYLVSNPLDINTIYAFSNASINIKGIKVNKIYKVNSTLYLSMHSALPDTDTNPNSPPYELGVSYVNYAPFSFSSTSNLDNYDNVLSTYLEYPYWIDDLQDLVVGDNNPIIKRIFYQPDRVNKNYYAIIDMYTKFNNNIEQKIIENDTSIINNNTYLFRFSSNDNQIGLTVNETLPIRIHGPDDTKRFSQCNQTQNMFFLTNTCN